MDINALSLQFTTYVWPTIAVLYVLHVFTRILRYWQVNRDPWLKWKTVLGIGSAIFFAMYSTFVSRTPIVSRELLAPYARFSSVLILVGLGVSVIGELHDVLVITRRRRALIHEMEAKKTASNRRAEKTPTSKLKRTFEKL